MAGRQLQRFKSTQLVSLFDWAGGHLPSSSLIGQQLRMGSTSTVSKSIKYSKERNNYESNLSELRKAWAKEQQEAALRRATEAEAIEAKRKAAKSQRAKDDAADKETRRLELLARQRAARELRVSSEYKLVEAYFFFFIFKNSFLPLWLCTPMTNPSQQPINCRHKQKKSVCVVRSYEWIF